MAMIQVVSFDSGLDPHEVLAWRYRDPENPGKGDELGTWTQLVVDESQEAILYRNGQALDLFGPGRYTLSTANMPLLSKVVNLPFGGESPFKAWVWFVNRVHSLDVKWGTVSPIQLQDPKYGSCCPCAPTASSASASRIPGSFWSSSSGPHPGSTGRPW
jgi:membrane protease subunit (stomatin/prohibitin family)